MLTAAVKLTTPTLFLGIWVSGFAAALGALIVSLLRARAAAHSAQELRDPAHGGRPSSVSGMCATRQPVRLLVGYAITTPMAGGVWR